MQERHWHQAFMSLLILGTLISPGMAQEGTPPEGSAVNRSAAARPRRDHGENRRPAYGFLATLDQTVGLTTEQQDAVRGLLASQRQAAQALREETDGKIRALLNAEQQKRFDTLLAEQKSRRAARFKRS